jgi:hypothetical protein
MYMHLVVSLTMNHQCTVMNHLKLTKLFSGFQKSLRFHLYSHDFYHRIFSSTRLSVS